MEHSLTLCACDFIDDEFDGFEFSNEDHEFIPLCIECAAPTTKAGNIWHCSETKDHTRLVFQPEDVPPFFGEDPESD